MAVQGALPNPSAPTAAHSSQMMHPQALLYTSMAPPQLHSYRMSTAPVSGASMGLQFPNKMSFSGPQATPTGSRGDVFASLNPVLESRSRNQAPTIPNSSTTPGGNPFW
ncbi:hypothetical protein NMG60_11027952 [Bertholletia excelsa]